MLCVKFFLKLFLLHGGTHTMLYTRLLQQKKQKQKKNLKVKKSALK